ncbi:tetratricopeptide TPR_2 [Deinococcus grandis]|uniref:Tetratricopeptide TPR_2 n=1 Tax=Deinococcus grandis TaxID=57498 RepID=A0A100HMH5_9DEIO|nr:tetratricopeptide repeat protein [Deinococcus grandis]BBN96561.1 hypothetical protein DEGR_32940 [Deinococcus grandis]GAQ23466.1 tetratricopeptide TPR_2 [Deinococcus grandis]
MPSRSTQRDSAFDESIAALIGSGQWDLARRTIEAAFHAARTGERFTQLLGWFESMPPAEPDDLAAARLHLRLHVNVPRQPELERVARTYAQRPVTAPSAHVMLAWRLAQDKRHEDALHHAELALRDTSRLTGYEQGLALRARAQARHHLKTPGWEDDYRAAIRLSDGRARTLTTVEFSVCQLFTGRHAHAIELLATAALEARGQAMEGWVMSTKGYAHLHHAELDQAQDCFEACVRLDPAHRGSGRNGLAAVLRAGGDWNRAEALYTQTLTRAEQEGNLYHLQQARRGLGHTARMRGQNLRAIEWLTQAAVTLPAERDSGQSWVFVDLAAAHVSLPRLEAAHVTDLLGRAGPLVSEDADRAEIVRAELARRQGDHARAAQLLRPLNPRLLWLREEASALPDLFTLLGPDAPHPLPRQDTLRVDVRAAGYPDVRVNGRPVTLPDLALVALVALLDAGGTLDAESLADAVRDDAPRTPRQRAQRASRAVQQLRGGLGWPGSVTHAHGRYRLDPGAAWSYDVLNLQRVGEPIPAFLRGVHAFPWVTDREQDLLLGGED